MIADVFGAEQEVVMTGKLKQGKVRLDVLQSMERLAEKKGIYA
jgi:hypothetical protein